MGLVLVDGSVVELRNHSPTPGQDFMVDPEEFADIRNAVAATWHTHPRNNVNLSATDFRMFLSLPQWKHYIVAERRVRSFVVRNNKVMLDEADCV